MKERKPTYRECKISEYEAQIGLNKMIIEDYQHDKVFCEGLQYQINQWQKKIEKLKQPSHSIKQK